MYQARSVQGGERLRHIHPDRRHLLGQETPPRDEHGDQFDVLKGRSAFARDLCHGGIGPRKPFRRGSCAIRGRRKGIDEVWMAHLREFGATDGHQRRRSDVGIRTNRVARRGGIAMECI
jgi:hypothetical protein